MPPDLRVISPSSYMADRLRNDGLRVAETIPNFVDDPGPVGHDVTSGVVVFIGILEPHKGPHILIDAFASTMQRHNLSLHVVGDGSMRSLLNDKVERLGASERIILTGRLPDDELRRRLSGAVALIVPSIWLENCPLVALEALSFGVPILASAIGGLNEIAASVDSSATFLPGNREDLGRKLLEVWHNWRGDTKLRRNARNAYTENYSPDRHIKRYMEVISKSTN
jgi:glycosyltransferase involved in cell wall biosynthesis